MTEIEALAAIEQIKQLKARYIRFMDTKDWAGYESVFAPDVVFDCFCNPRTAVWTALSGARVRVGYPDKGWRSGVYTHHVRPRTLSAVGFHLTSIARLGWPAAAFLPVLNVAIEKRA